MSAIIVQERKFCCIWFCFALQSQLTHFVYSNSRLPLDILLCGIKRNGRNNIIFCILMSFTHQVEVFLLIVLSIVALLFIQL